LIDLALNIEFVGHFDLPIIASGPTDREIT
jgi:hypothetical protein